jgi:hypothetical protein
MSVISFVHRQSNSYECVIVLVLAIYHTYILSKVSADKSNK